MTIELERKTTMKQMMIVLVGLLLMVFAANAQEMKTHKHHTDSTGAEMKMAKPADTYICPMHSDVTSDKPGKCPKCKMDLVKQEPAKTKEAKAVYVCPMHSEIKSDKPGKCPKCKMALVPEKKSK
jgi:predicted Zn-ribbon and HTH transcriptional regulator